MHARRVSDPGMGGAYLTLLNTIANMGYIVPRSPLFALIDVLTVSVCTGPGGGTLDGLECPKKAMDFAGPNACTQVCACVCRACLHAHGPVGTHAGCTQARAHPPNTRTHTPPAHTHTQAGGTCSLASDGFYTISWVSLVLGAGIGALYIRFLPALMALPLSRWRAGRVATE